MKLHLPYILRAAVLASVALSAVHHTHAAEAVYDYMIQQYTSGPHTTATSGIEGAAYVQHNLVDARAQNWVLNVTASNMSPDETVIPTTDILSFGNIGWMTENDSKYEISIDEEFGFGIFIAPDSDIILAYNKAGDSSKTVTHVLSTASNWNWSSVANVTFTLSWDAEQKSLTLEGGSVQRRSDGSISDFKRIEGLDYNLPSSWLSGGGNLLNTLVFISGAGATVTSNLYTQGTEEGWLVSGRTVLGREYEDKIAGADTKREMGADENVQFVGASGVIYATENKTFGNDVTVAVDLQNIQAGSAIGFGADAGAELTVTKGTNAINSADGTALVPVLNIVGDGVVKLCYEGSNAANLSQVKVNIDKDATLKIDDSATSSVEGARINLSTGIVGSNAGIVKTGQATNLTIVTESGEKNSVISLKKLENEEGSIVIEGAGSLKVQDIVTKSGDISISGGASHQVKNLDIDGDVIIEEGNALSTTGEVEIAGVARVEGTLNTTQSASLTASGVTVQGAGVVQAKEIVGNAVNVAGVSVGTGSGAVLSLLKGNVIVNSKGIFADEIVDGTPIEFSDDSEGTVTAGKMAGVNMTAGGTQVLTNAGTDSSIVMSGTSTVARGTITAETATVTGKYELAAQQLELQELDSDAVSVEWDGTKYAVLKNVSIYNAQTGAGDNVRVMKASGITAETVTVQAGSVLIGADVEASDIVGVGDNAILEDVRINTANGLIVGNGAALNKVSIQSGTLKNEGKVVLNNVTFGGSGTQFGGDQGRDYTVDKASKGVENVVLTGTLTGSDLSISNMALYAEGLQFAKGEKGVTYTILETDGKTITYEPDVTNYELYIQSYVRAELVLDGNTVKIVGEEDEAGIKNELTGTDNAAATMTALESPDQDMVDGSALSELNKYIGHVNRYSLEERKAVLEALSGASLTALADSQRRGVQDHQDNLRNRIIQMGGGTNAGLTTDWEYAGIQAWAQADGSFSTSDGSGDECGYDFDTWGATVGANMDLTANTVVGLAFSASYGEIKSDGADRASGNNDAQYISLYARHQKERWVQMLILTAGMNDMDLERRVLGYTAEGDTEGTTLSAYYELGYTIGLNYEFTHILQPMVSVSVTSAKVDGYTESGSLDNAALEYDGDSYVYGKVGIGARYQGVMYETVHERNAIVEARALVTQDFGDTTESAKVALGASGMYEVTGADTSGTGFELGVGFSIPVEQHTTLYADADMTMAPDYTGFRGNIGVRYDF